jgi:hypothetical protein
MVVGSLGVSPHPRPSIWLPQKTAWLFLCCHHFIHLSLPKTVVGIVLGLLLVLLAGHKSSSQSWIRKKQTNEFFFPSFKTFPLQTETKTK